MIDKLLVSLIGVSMLLVAACAPAPPFDNPDGEYIEPDVIMIGGEIHSGAIPNTPSCPSAVIYSSDAQTVNSCVGAKAVATALCGRAEAAAWTLAGTVVCPDPGICPLRAESKLFEGWSCGGNPTPVVVTCGVEVQVLCWNMF